MSDHSLILETPPIGWMQVSFSDACTRVQDTALPLANGQRLYLGLEHLASGLPALVGRGAESNVRSGKTSFRSGDVLFGKLRPYLRKSVLVSEKGICSTDILVFRATDKCIPEFFCLLTHTDEFVGHAKATTSGVQHPRTSWSGLREFKLHVPPVPMSWQVVKVGDVAKIQSGGTPARNVAENWQSGTIPWVKTGEIDYCVIADTEEKITPAGLASSAARLFPAGTLLMAMYGQKITRGRVALLGVEATTNQACASITPYDESKVSSRFLYYFFEYRYEDLRKLGHGANQRNMNAALIRGFPLTFPKPEEEAEIVAILTALDAKRQIHRRKHAALNALFRTLLVDDSPDSGPRPRLGSLGVRRHVAARNDS